MKTVIPVEVEMSDEQAAKWLAGQGVPGPVRMKNVVDTVHATVMAAVHLSPVAGFATIPRSGGRAMATKRHAWDRPVEYRTKRRACTLCGVTAHTFGVGAGRVWSYTSRTGQPLGTHSPECVPFALAVHGHTVRDGDTVVARLFFSGPMVRVLPAEGEALLGRLLCEAPGRYSPWTAPSSHSTTPFDRQLAPASDIASAVQVLIDVKEVSKPEEETMGTKFEHGDITNSDVKVKGGKGGSVTVKTGNISGSTVAVGKGAKAGG